MSINTANTISLHRVLRATPEKIYRAFLDPDAMAKWLPPNGFTGKVHHLDAKVGGMYKMSFTEWVSWISERSRDVVCAKFRPSASHGTPCRYSKTAHRCDPRRRGRSGDHNRGRRRV